MSCNGSTFRNTVPLWGESIGHPSQRACNLVHWCYFQVSLNKLLNKHSSGWWSEIPWHSCDITVMSVHCFSYWGYPAKKALSVGPFLAGYHPYVVVYWTPTNLFLISNKVPKYHHFFHRRFHCVIYPMKYADDFIAPWPLRLKGYCPCLCLSVRSSICTSVHKPLSCPHDNLSQNWAGITKFAPNMRLGILSTVMENGVYWPWTSRSFWPFWLSILRYLGCPCNDL